MERSSRGNVALYTEQSNNIKAFEDVAGVDARGYSMYLFPILGVMASGVWAKLLTLPEYKSRSSATVLRFRSRLGAE
jgi:hypothetical protein